MIRQGFVSNSSSSSFIIQVPKEKLEFDQILDYYKVNKELSPKLRTWLNIIIDNILEKRVDEEADEDNGYEDYEESESNIHKVYVIPYILGDFYKEYFKDAFPHKDLTEEELEAIRLKALKSFEYGNWIEYYLRDYGSSDYGDLSIPWDISREIGKNCSNIFTDPSVAISYRD